MVQRNARCQLPFCSFKVAILSVGALLLIGGGPVAAATLFATTLWGSGTVADLQSRAAGTWETALSPTNATLMSGAFQDGVTYTANATSIADVAGSVTFHTLASLSSADYLVGPGLVSDATALAGLGDTLVVTSATRSGAGSLQFSMTYDGTLGASSSAGSMSANAFGVVCPGLTGCPPGAPENKIATLALLAGGVSTVSGTSIIGSIPFIYDRPLDISLYLVINALFFGPLDSTVNVSTDFSNTASLGPIGVFDSFGQRDLSARIISQGGGVNYAVATPEPATWAMLVAGFSAIGAILRYRRRRRSLLARPAVLDRPEAEALGLAWA